MVLRPRGRGRVGRRRHLCATAPSRIRAGAVAFPASPARPRAAPASSPVLACTPRNDHAPESSPSSESRTPASPRSSTASSARSSPSSARSRSPRATASSASAPTATSQMVVLDTPGLLNPRYELQRAMRATALARSRDADVIVYLADATERYAAARSRRRPSSTAPPRAPVISVLNKVDALRPVERDELRAPLPDAALHLRAHRARASTRCSPSSRRALPESPFLYPEDEISTQPRCASSSRELVRETALEQLDDEVPTASRARSRSSGRTGRRYTFGRSCTSSATARSASSSAPRAQRIRDIGRAARAKIEALVGEPVYLDLWVKVLPNWRQERQRSQALRLPAPRRSAA